MSLSFTEAAVQLFAAQANRETAGPMEAYMKNQFPFLGIKTPLRRELSKRLYKEHGIPQNWEEAVRQLWALREREYQYVALDLLDRVKKRFTPGHVELAEALITSKSWWDTVDYLASHTVGTLFRLHPSLIEDYNDRWLEGENMWLWRTALLFQLSYKEKTDEELLFKNIRFCAGSKEFFIQKAIGWSLREYAKTNPDAVRHFIEMTPLVGLSRREALKHF